MTKRMTLGWFLLLSAAPVAAQTWHGPFGYLSSSDSPFDLSGAGGRAYLETFEDGLNAKGLSVSSGSNWIRPGPITDSVDADDGIIDGFGNDGHSWFTGGGSVGLTWTFDDGALGGFPTSVGLVWTDGAGTALFQAWDAQGVLIGSIGPTPVGSGGIWTGETDEDRFFGVSDSGGISKVSISNTSGGIEVDHVQYVMPNTCAPDLGFQGPGAALAWLCGEGLNAGERSVYGIEGAPASAPGVLLLSVAGFANVPVLGGTLVSFGGFVVQLPVAVDTVGELCLPLVGVPPPAIDVVFQTVLLDGNQPAGLAFTNAVLAQLGQ